MKSLRLTVLFILVITLIAVPILAQQDRGLVDRFKQLDRNEDGKLTRQELKMPRIFSQMDKDGDGTVTFEEARGFVAGGATRRQGGGEAESVPVPEDFQAWFNKLDEDGNRVIEQGETDSRTLRGADRNADGRISIREGQRYHGDLLAKQAALSNPGIFEPWEHQGPEAVAHCSIWRSAAEPPVHEVPTHRRKGRQRHVDYRHGVHAFGNPPRNAVCDLERLESRSKATPWPGPSVVVKRSADAPWEVEVGFGERGGRAGSLRSVKFTSDASGKSLDAPVSLLMCGVGGPLEPGKVLVWVRDDTTGNWIKTIAGEHTGWGSPEVRVIFDHVDKVTGVHHVFAAASNGMLFRGAYDAVQLGVFPGKPPLNGRVASGDSWRLPKWTIRSTSRSILSPPSQKTAGSSAGSTAPIPSGSASRAGNGPIPIPTRHVHGSECEV